MKTLVLIFCFISYSALYAQGLNASDTSEQSVRRYQNIIKSNKQLVDFIEYTFVKKGIPRHLKNLAVIESGLDHTQTSHAGAKGLWQFMSGHANDYGLTDENRSDMYKSTKTAAISLKNLYKKYGNWVTVVAAYNCGEGNIQKAMNKANSRAYTDFAAYLPSETQNHVKKYLNASYATGELNQVLNDYRTFAANKKAFVPFKSDFSTSQENLAETKLNGAFSIDAIAEWLDVSNEQILAWNPKLQEKLNEKGESDFYLPKDLMVNFLMNKNKILTNSLKN
ncbi:lytic transglycosylase domain-containing protein [Epilithonimonas lactis]|uniref:Lytic murein transglycosylase n=1 Tax=Epilithonimonas lactis TaxID=421072 RepID=A0A085B7H2_9FLAO|nr:lytic transglycosylase domain-containing protein [Epilithonimonas lactis]KFC18417.1 lytic murein transglycosylase [Epilithonimonas lactis]SER01867.1 membrane-bound lytic murein transglycosylase D [Epilithonimonas lactis]